MNEFEARKQQFEARKQHRANPEALKVFRTLAIDTLEDVVKTMCDGAHVIANTAANTAEETIEEVNQRRATFQAFVSAQVLMNQISAEFFHMNAAGSQADMMLRTTQIKGFPHCGKSTWIAKNFQPEWLIIVPNMGDREHMYARIKKWQPDLEFNPFRILDISSFHSCKDHLSDCTCIVIDDYSAAAGNAAVNIHLKAAAIGSLSSTDYVFLG